MTIDKDNIETDRAIFRDLINNSNDAIFVNDPQTGRIIFVNDKACTSLGYERQELLKMGVMDIETTFPDNFSWQNHVNELRQGGSLILEGIHRRKNGTTFPVEINVSYAVLNTREYMVAVVRDITERKRMEELLRESEEKYRLLVEAANSVILTWDTAGNVTFLNDFAQRFFGFSKEELLGRNVVGTIVPEKESSGRDLECLMQEIRRDPDRFEDNENENITKDGRRVWVRWANKAITDEHGRLTGILSVGIDITERKQAEAALQLTRFTVDNVADAVYWMNLKAQIVDVNETACSMLGYTREEFLNLTVLDIDPDFTAERWANAWETLKGQGKMTLETKHRTKDGRIIPVEIMANYLSFGGTELDCAFARDISHRKRAEEEIKKSEERYKRITEGITDYIYSVRLEGGVAVETKHGPGCEVVTGYSEEEYARDPGLWLSMVPPEDRSRVLEQASQSAAGKDASPIEHLIVRKDGAMRWVRNTPVLHRDEHSTLLGYDGLIQDITERKKAREALRAISSRQKAILAAVPDIIMEMDSNKKYTWANEAGRRFFGDNVIGKEAAFYFEGEQDTYQTVHPLLEGFEDVIYIESWQRRQDGEKRLLAWWCQVLKDGEGNVTGALSTARDITGQKQAELALKEKEEKYRSLFEAATDGIFILGANGFIDCNQKGSDMYGLPKEKLIGRWPKDFSPDIQPNGRPSSELAGEIFEAAMRGIPKTFEWQSKRADGSLFDVDINLNRIELGGEICLQAVVRDITDRKRLEQEIVKRQKLEAIGTLAGGIAHDFNNLLQGIFGYISMAKLTHDQKEKSLDMLEQAERALHMSVNLTTQLLTFSKGGKPVKRTMHLQPLIENSLKFALSGSKSGYRIIPDEDLWAVKADEGQIGQVIQNIVLNADQAMPEGGTIVITAKNVQQEEAHYKLLEPGKYVEVSIRDTGIGIPEKYLQNIFDPYFTTKEKGSGLGLATSYSIIKNHRGMIDVESEVGRGTTFFIYLPAVEAAEEIRQEPAAVSVARKGKILVMDDEKLVLNVAGEMIKALGHDVDLAEHGQSAIEKYRAAMDSGKPYDIVILDLTIRGGMGGEETVEQLLAIDPGARAIVSSGYSDDAVVSEYHQYGFKAFLSKPYKIAELRDTLNMLLGS